MNESFYIRHSFYGNNINGVLLLSIMMGKVLAFTIQAKTVLLRRDESTTFRAARSERGQIVQKIKNPTEGYSNLLPIFARILSLYS